MTRMFVPKSVREMSEIKPMNKINGLKYLATHVKRVVASDKYLLDNRILVLDVAHSTDKRFIERALNTLTNEQNLVSEVRSLNRKSHLKKKARNTILSESFKRMYIKFSSSFDKSIIMEGGENDSKD